MRVLMITLPCPAGAIYISSGACEVAPREDQRVTIKMESSVRPENLPALTTLRFAAAGMIFMLHAANYFPWAKFTEGIPLAHGVSFFFVLSGFILTHAYSSRDFSFKSFIRSRIGKLWPIHFVMAFFVVFFVRHDSQQFPGSGFFDPWVVFGFNIALLHSLFPYVNYVFSWNSVSWSISTEMFFYLAFPFLLRGLKGTWHLKLLICLVLISFYGIAFVIFNVPASSPLGTINQKYATYASPFFRLFEFSLGMAAYVGWRAVRERIKPFMTATLIEFAAIILAIWWGLSGVQQAGDLFNATAISALWYSSAGSCLVCAAVIMSMANSSGAIGKALSLRPCVWFGEISFALYMAHQALMKWMHLGFWAGYPILNGPAVVVGVCILCAALLHHAVEKPMHKMIAGKGAAGWLMRSRQQKMRR